MYWLLAWLCTFMNSFIHSYDHTGNYELLGIINYLARNCSGWVQSEITAEVDRIGQA